LNWNRCERQIEAIVFAAGEAIELSRIAQALEVEEPVIRHCINRIRERYLSQQSPFDLVMLDNAVQMCTLPEYADVIRSVLELRRTTPLSQAALEVLATIAYNQPVTRSFVEQVRGVDCSSIIRSLVEKGLIEEAGRLNIPGKPISYRTTSVFLRSFGLNSIEQLPILPEEPEEPKEEPEQLEGQMDFFELS
jgi:segregation and condensation protein B